MIDAQVESAVGRLFLTSEYGALKVSRNSLPTGWESGFGAMEDFANQPFAESVSLAREKAVKNVPTIIQEGMG